MKELSSEPLSVLVGTMKKSEKRYFRLFTQLQKGEKLVSLVFGFYEQQNLPGLEDFIQNHGAGKTASWFPMLRKRTYDQVLSSLEDLFEDPGSRIYRLLKRAEILIGRELFKEAFSLLKEARKEAVTREHWPLAYMAVERQYKIAIQAGLSPKKCAEMVKDLERILGQLNNAKQYYVLAQYIYQFYVQHGIVTSQKDHRELKKFRQHPLLRSEDQALTIESRENYHLAWGFLYGMAGDYERSYQHTRNRTQLYFDHPFKISNNRYAYLYVLNNALITAQYAKKYNDLEFYLVKLDEARAELITPLEKKTAFFMRNHELSYCIEKSDWERAWRSVQQIESELPGYESSLGEIQKRVLFVFIAFVYFVRDEPRTAIAWMNKVVYKGAPWTRIDLHCFFYILYFIFHYEAGAGRDFLYSIYQSAFRYINLKDRMNRFYAVMKEFMKSKLLKDLPSGQLREAFRELGVELEVLAREEQKVGSTIYFDLGIWVEKNLKK